MSPAEKVVAALAAVAAIVGGWLTYRASRLNALEERVDALEKQNRLHWRYNRDLVDHIYRGAPPPPPPAPEGLVM